MFTRNSIVLSNNIKTPLTAISRAIGNILQLTYGQLVKQLFSNQEQGFAYDPNDLTTLYQDAAGTIPVTAAGQPVGLMLDKSKGLVLSGEKWVDKSVTFFGSSSRISPNVYRIYSPDGVISQISCGTGATGKWHEITFTIDSIVSGSVTTDFSNSPTWNNTGIKKFKVFLLNPIITFKRAGITDAVISNISVKELHGNHTYQTVSASRPILQRNVTTGAYYLAFDGVDDSLQTNNIDFTMTDKVSLFAGVRKLSTVSGMVIELSSSLSTNNGSFYLAAPAGQVYPNQILFANRGTLFSSAQNPNLPPPTNVVVSAKGDISTDTTSLRTNGTQFSSAADLGTGKYGNHPLYIGTRGGTSASFNGHIYSLIGIGRLTTNAETTALEKLIAKNTGVTLSV